MAPTLDRTIREIRRSTTDDYFSIIVWHFRVRVGQMSVEYEHKPRRFSALFQDECASTETWILYCWACLAATRHWNPATLWKDWIEPAYTAASHLILPVKVYSYLHARNCYDHAMDGWQSLNKFILHFGLQLLCFSTPQLGQRFSPEPSS